MAAGSRKNGKMILFFVSTSSRESHRHVRDDQNRREESSQGVVDSVQGSCERGIYCFNVLRNGLSLRSNEEFQAHTFENLFRRRP